MLKAKSTTTSAALALVLALAALPAGAEPEPGSDDTERTEAAGGAPAREGEPWTHEIDEIVVTAARSPERSADIAANVTVLGPQEIRLSATHRLDELLRQVPGFNLLRQSNAIASSAGIQGVSLRGVGPTSSGRTLVLVDGTPINDPQTGSVAWSRVPLGSVERVEVVRGGGSGIWGSLAMGGIIQILTSRPDSRSLRVRGQLGSHETRDVEASATLPHGKLVFSGGGSYFDTEGYRIWREDQLGEIDTPAGVTDGTLLGRVEYRHSDEAQFFLDASYADEDRRKGTPYLTSTLITRNVSTGLDLTRRRSSLAFRVFGTGRTYTNTSSSVTSDRTSELPRVDEYHSPSTTIGASAIWTRALDDVHTLSIGGDQQWVHSERHQYTSYSSSLSEFTRDTHTDGKTRTGGVYLQDILSPSPRWRIRASVRADAIRNNDASVVVRDAQTDSVVSETTFENESRLTVNPSLGVVHHASERVTLRASAYRAFRAPTLMELYTGFFGRDGVVTVANSGIDPETLVGAEAGGDYRVGRFLSARVNLFWNEVENTVTQRTIGRADPDSATTIDPCGVVPAGGVCRQTDNIGRLRSRGSEVQVTVRPAREWTFTGSYVFTDATLTKSDDPSLVGNDVRQVPRHQFVLRSTFDRPSLAALSLQGRFVGDRFEDDRNSLPIAGFFVLNATIARQVQHYWEVFVGVENVFDERFEVRTSTVGLVEVGMPRFVHVGLRLTI